MITLNKELAKKIGNFLSNPITALIFSIILSAFFWYISISYKNPSYYYTSPELVAKKSNIDLKILFKDKEVPNIYYTTLILWNDGDDFIDYNDFVKSKPIKFYSKENIQILSISLDKKSRKDLSFNSSIQNNKIIIKLSEDEALEEGDGASFNVLYSIKSKTTNPRFNLDSRIKGTKDGFIFKDVTNFKKRNFKNSIYFLWALIITLLSIRIVTLYLFKKEIVFRNKEFIFIITLFVITIYLTVQQIFFSTNLDWIK